MAIMSGFYGGNGGMLPFRSRMFVDGGRARVAHLTRTWKDDRAVQLRRRGYGVLLRIIFPREPLRIVRDRP